MLKCNDLKCNDCGKPATHAIGPKMYKGSVAEPSKVLCSVCYNDSWDNDLSEDEEVLADPFPAFYNYERADRLCKELTEKCQGNDDGSNVVIIDLGVPPKRKYTIEECRRHECPPED